MPLAPGAVWVYDVVKRSEPNGTPNEERAEVRMEVLDVATSPEATVFRVRGSFDGSVEEWLVARLPDGYYQLPIGLLEQREDLDAAAIRAAGALWVPTPLVPGYRVHDADTVYYTEVGAGEELSLGGVEGAPTPQGRAFTLTYRTSPDHTITTIVPGLGVVAYEYAHHGTVDEVSVALKSFTPGRP